MKVKKAFNIIYGPVEASSIWSAVMTTTHRVWSVAPIPWFQMDHVVLHKQLLMAIAMVPRTAQLSTRMVPADTH